MSFSLSRKQISAITIPTLFYLIKWQRWWIEWKKFRILDFLPHSASKRPHCASGVGCCVKGSVMIQRNSKAMALHLCEHFHTPYYLDLIIYMVFLTYFGICSQLLFWPFSWPFLDLSYAENKSRIGGISPVWIVITHPSFIYWQI